MITLPGFFVVRIIQKEAISCGRWPLLLLIDQVFDFIFSDGIENKESPKFTRQPQIDPMSSPLLSRFPLNNYALMALVLLGTLVRLFFGLQAQGWLLAPDQLAWGLMLEDFAMGEEGHYDQLVHYPHEGGSIFISLLALLLRPFEAWLPALSLAALVVELFGRTIQLLVVRKIFGGPSAWLFGIWSVLAIPTLLPWATVNFGLHALSGFWPFLFLLSITTSFRHIPRYVMAGVVTGLALTMSYDNLVLLPAFGIWALFFSQEQTPKWKQLPGFGLIALLVLFPHLMARSFLDAGFVLKSFDWGNIRGESWLLWMEKESWYSRLWKTGYHSLPGSTMMPEVVGILASYVRKFWLLIGGIGLIAGTLHFRRQSHAFWVGLSLLGFFLLFYAFSPFFTPSADSSIYVQYRHLTYILPLMVALGLHGLLYLDRKTGLAGLTWIAISAVGSISYISQATQPTATFDPAIGWVLTQKLGHQPERLFSVVQRAKPELQPLIWNGVGWGTTSAILEATGAPNQEKTDRLMGLLFQYPDSVSLDLIKGVRMSFEPWLTPTLDTNFLPLLELEMAKEWEIPAALKTPEKE